MKKINEVKKIGTLSKDEIIYEIYQLGNATFRYWRIAGGKTIRSEKSFDSEKECIDDIMSIPEI
jgi:hypothetical protein|uniref:UPF0339 protein n=1 Tax=Podoviridae sp. ctKS020 TaxID=2826552 RepID=A0A8S5QSK2_9CAUD|nr:MAG TPA: UPF0339 protein [Podoviridae sp. ctKS020]